MTALPQPRRPLVVAEVERQEVTVRQWRTVLRRIDYVLQVAGIEVGRVRK